MGLNVQQVPLRDERGFHRAHSSTREANVVSVSDTPAMRDLGRGKLDIAFFAERWLGIEGHPGQVAWWEACAKRADDGDGKGWRPEYLTTCVSAGNRAGKTLALAVIVLHHTFYKLGIKPPEPTMSDAIRFMGVPYQWFHLAIDYGRSRLVYRELDKILSGVHPAQKGRGCPLLSEFGPVIEWKTKYQGEYEWVRVSPIFGGGEIHFRTSQEKAKGVLGEDANGISFDEAAFELYLTLIFNEVLNPRRISTGGPLHMISTPTEGHNEFYDLWDKGNPENPNRDPKVMSFRMSTRDNVGYGISEQDFEDVVRQMDPYLIPQNIDGHFIEAHSAYFSARSIEATFVDMPDETPSVRGHRYVQGVDPAIAADATASLVLDITTKPWRGVRLERRAGHQSTLHVVRQVADGHRAYSTDGAFCTTISDDTGIGKVLSREFSQVIRPFRTFDFAGTAAKKLALLADLKAVMDRGDLRLPKGWVRARRELLGYRLDDKKIETDVVMALAIAVKHALRNPDKPLADTRFDYFAGG